MKKREFSLYDMEQFLREAGAERINEKAVVSLEQELEDTVRELLDEASVYASYAGRRRLIKSSDISLVRRGGARPSRAALRSRILAKRPARADANRIRMQRISRLVEARMLEQ